jgi:hypothetical protein
VVNVRGSGLPGPCRRLRAPPSAARPRNLHLPCPALRVRGVMRELAGRECPVAFGGGRVLRLQVARALGAPGVTSGSRSAGMAAARIRRAASTDSSSQAAALGWVSGLAPGPDHIRAGWPADRAATARTGLSVVTPFSQIPLSRSKVLQCLSAGQPGLRRGAGVQARRGSGRRPSGLRFPRDGCRSSRRPGPSVRQSRG